MKRKATSSSRDFITAWVERMRARLSDPLLQGSEDVQRIARIIDELEADYEAHQNATLSAREASEESGYSRQQIANLRRLGVIGETRRDLPRKPGHGVVREPRLGVRVGSSIADTVLNAHRRRAG